MTAKEWAATPWAETPMAKHCIADLAERESELLSAQQALLTEGQARNAAEERAEKAETATEIHRLQEEGAGREIAMTARVYSDEIDALAAQLAEMQLAAQLAECRAELADAMKMLHVIGVWKKSEPDEQWRMSYADLCARIEARRAKEANDG